MRLSLIWFRVVNSPMARKLVSLSPCSFFPTGMFAPDPVIDCTTCDVGMRYSLSLFWSSSTCISRLVPPSIFTSPTPSMRTSLGFMISLARSYMPAGGRSATRAIRSMGVSEGSSCCTSGSSMSSGSLLRTRLIFDRTSWSTFFRSVSRPNSMVIIDILSRFVEYMCFIPPIAPSSSSRGLVMSFSISSGAAPA